MESLGIVKKKKTLSSGSKGGGRLLRGKSKDTQQRGNEGPKFSVARIKCKAENR